MATLISKIPDMKLIEMLLECDSTIDFVNYVTKATGLSLPSVVQDLRRVQRDIQVEIGHRTVIGTWEGTWEGR